MSFEFTKLHADNYSQAFQIQLSCHTHPWSEAVFTDCLSQPYFAYQLLDSTSNGQAIGYYVGLAVAGEATLMDIGLGIAQRGKGLSQALMNHFINQCENHQCREAWLEVRESNEVAIGLYEKLGFEWIETRNAYYPTESGRENGLIMQLKW